MPQLSTFDVSVWKHDQTLVRVFDMLHHTPRVCEQFVYYTVKITRLHDYQTWETHFWRNSQEVQSFVGFFS